MSLQEFFYMDGYGLYVWPSYAIALAVLVGNMMGSRRALRRATEEALRRIQGPTTRGPSALKGRGG